MKRFLPFLMPLCIVALFSGGDAARAQSSGGYAASYLRRTLLAREIAMGGAFAPFAAGGSAIFSNSAALPGLEHQTALASLSILPNGERFRAFGYGMPVGSFAGISAGILGYGISDVQGYTADERPTGSIGSEDFAFSLGGGLTIGPGALGATVRYLRTTLSGTDGSASGYTVDLSGSLTLDDRYFFSLALNNIAGETKGPRELAPWNTRLGASYLLPMEERSESSRLDPSGIIRTRRLRPRAYLLLATEMRLGQYEAEPNYSLALEWVPVVTFPIGLRGGYNTLGDFAFGFSYDLPVEFVNDLRIELAARRDYELGDISSHITISAAFGSDSRP